MKSRKYKPQPKWTECMAKRCHQFKLMSRGYGLKCSPQTREINIFTKLTIGCIYGAPIKD